MPDDRQFVRIIDASMAEAARKSGAWLACRPGCAQCCIGPFPISQLDARRLRQGLAALETRDPERAARVRERARAAVVRMAPDFPGDPETGVLAEGADAVARFETLADDDPCPALDPETRTCDLYSARPVTCRMFGPAVRYGRGALAACELCYAGASDEQIAACAVDIDPDRLESALLDELERATGARGQTLVAFALK